MCHVMQGASAETAMHSPPPVPSNFLIAKLPVQ